MLAPFAPVGIDEEHGTWRYVSHQVLEARRGQRVGEDRRPEGRGAPDGPSIPTFGDVETRSFAIRANPCPFGYNRTQVVGHSCCLEHHLSSHGEANAADPHGIHIS